jgi:hypothetical protein
MTLVPLGMLAHTLMVSSRRVQQMAADGTIPPAAPGGMYDLEDSVLAYVRFLHRHEPHRDLRTARTRLLTAQADRAQARLDQLRGESFPAAQVDHLWRAAREIVLQRFATVPGEVAAAIGMFSTAGEREALMRKVIDAALCDLAGMQIVVQDKPPDETEGQRCDEPDGAFKLNRQTIAGAPRGR